MPSPQGSAPAGMLWPLRLLPGDDLHWRACRHWLHRAHHCRGVLAPLPDWEFTREPDAGTGWAELVIRPHPG